MGKRLVSLKLKQLHTNNKSSVIFLCLLSTKDQNLHLLKFTEEVIKAHEGLERVQKFLHEIGFRNE